MLPEFRLPCIQGEELTPAKILEKPSSLLVFFKRTCETSLLTLNFITDLVSREPALGEYLFLISQDSAEETTRLLQETAISLPIAVDHPGYLLSQAFDFQFVPALFRLDSSGKTVEESQGFHKAEFEKIFRNLIRENRLTQIPVFQDLAKVPIMRPG